VAQSIDAVIFDRDAKAMETIYKLADQALYDAKRAGWGT
jgi:GGDEF domain-containing protein